MYYNGCFFTKNPSQALSGKKEGGSQTRPPHKERREKTKGKERGRGRQQESARGRRATRPSAKSGSLRPEMNHRKHKGSNMHRDRAAKRVIARVK